MNETQYKLSMIIPCFKVEKYLSRCLDALLAEAACFEGLELVCINDGSPDGCLKILREYEQKNPKQITVIDQENKGVWKARKAGIEAARGQYIGFADPDDYVKPGFVTALYDAAAANDADIACCGFERTEEETGKVLSREMTAFPYPAFDFSAEPGLMPEVNVALWNKIYRAELVKGMGDIPDIPKVLDDMVFFQLIARNAGKIVFTHKILVAYMVRSDSIISSLKQENIREVYKAALELKTLFARENPEKLAFLDAYAFLHLGISLMHRVSAAERDRGRLREYLKENREFLDREFPGWKNNPYISLKYVFTHKGANKKLLLVHTVYRMGLMVPFLRLYRDLTKKLGIDIKW